MSTKKTIIMLSAQCVSIINYDYYVFSLIIEHKLQTAIHCNIIILAKVIITIICI